MKIHARILVAIIALLFAPHVARAVNPVAMDVNSPFAITERLMYWREYRSMAPIALAYEVSEPTVHRTIRKIEGALLAWGQFALAGKKALSAPEMEWQVMVVDATETPVERPQKNNGVTSAAKRSGTRAKHR